MSRIEEAAARSEKFDLDGQRMRVCKELAKVLRLGEERVSELWNTLPYSDRDQGWTYEEDGLQFLGRVEKDESGKEVVRVYYLRGRYRNLLGRSVAPKYLMADHDLPEPFTDFRELQKQFREEDSAAAQRNFTSIALSVIFVLFSAASLTVNAGKENFGPAVVINVVFLAILVGFVLGCVSRRTSSQSPRSIAEQAVEA